MQARSFCSFVLLVLCFAVAAMATPETSQPSGVEAPAPSAEAPTPSMEPSADGLPGLVPGLAKQPEIQKTTCSASTSCWNGTTVSCSLPSGTCQDVPSNCAWGQRGYVKCGNSTTYCPICPPNCSTKPSCADINAGNYPSNFCPADCNAGGGLCGACFNGPGGCMCTE